VPSDSHQARRPREHVEEQLREAILSGEFGQGDKLPTEAELARQFAVSRTTVREALRALAAAGLISKVPGVAGGSFVRSIDHRALGSALGESLDVILRLGSVTRDEVAQMRRLLELPAAALAAEHRTAADLERVDEILAREAAAEAGDPALSEIDVSFHSAVAEASGNRVLASVVAALHRAARPAAALEAASPAGRAAAAHHREIGAAIAAGDATAAAAAMAAHLDWLARHEAGGVVASGTAAT
jgi:GntR family transcriptional regulator, transcriptional repressor for pyruvate dehydrogenase complex